MGKEYNATKKGNKDEDGKNLKKIEDFQKVKNKKKKKKATNLSFPRKDFV